MTTLREKRHRQCMVTIGRLAEQRELAFRRLAIVSDRLKDERARLKRLTKELPAKPAPAPTWRLREEQLQAEALPTLYQKGSEPDLTIPDFLKRDAKDKADRAEIEAHKAEVKATKTKARIDRLKAAQRGDLRKMPLTGKAALKAIREG